MNSEEMAAAIFYSYVTDRTYNECLTVDTDDVYERMAQTFGDTLTSANLRLMADAIDCYVENFDSWVKDWFSGLQEKKNKDTEKTQNRGEI